MSYFKPPLNSKCAPQNYLVLFETIKNVSTVYINKKFEDIKGVIVSFHTDHAFVCSHVFYNKAASTYKYHRFLLAILLVFEILLFKMLLLLMYATGHQWPLLTGYCLLVDSVCCFIYISKERRILHTQDTQLCAVVGGGLCIWFILLLIKSDQSVLWLVELLTINSCFNPLDLVYYWVNTTMFFINIC